MIRLPFSRVRSVVTGRGRDRSIAHWIVRHRIMIAIAWLLAAVVLVLSSTACGGVFATVDSTT